MYNRKSEKYLRLLNYHYNVMDELHRISGDLKTKITEGNDQKFSSISEEFEKLMSLWTKVQQICFYQGTDIYKMGGFIQFNYEFLLYLNRNVSKDLSLKKFHYLDEIIEMLKNQDKKKIEIVLATKLRILNYNFDTKSEPNVKLEKQINKEIAIFNSKKIPSKFAYQPYSLKRLNSIYKILEDLAKYGKDSDKMTDEYLEFEKQYAKELNKKFVRIIEASNGMSIENISNSMFKESSELELNNNEFKKYTNKSFLQTFENIDNETFPTKSCSDLLIKRGKAREIIKEALKVAYGDIGEGAILTKINIKASPKKITCNDTNFIMNYCKDIETCQEYFIDSNLYYSLADLYNIVYFYGRISNILLEDEKYLAEVSASFNELALLDYLLKNADSLKMDKYGVYTNFITVHEAEMKYDITTIKYYKDCLYKFREGKTLKEYKQYFNSYYSSYGKEWFEFTNDEKIISVFKYLSALEISVYAYNILKNSDEKGMKILRYGGLDDIMEFASDKKSNDLTKFLNKIYRFLKKQNEILLK